VPRRTRKRKVTGGRTVRRQKPEQRQGQGKRPMTPKYPKKRNRGKKENIKKKRRKKKGGTKSRPAQLGERRKEKRGHRGEVNESSQVKDSQNHSGVGPVL